MSAKRSSNQTRVDKSGERTRQAAASADATAFATTTGAMLLGVLAAEMEQDRANALGAGRDEHHTVGVGIPHDAPESVIRHPAADATTEHWTPALPLDGDAVHRVQTSPESFADNNTGPEAVPNEKIVHSAVGEQPASEVATSSADFQPSHLDVSANDSADVSPGRETDHSALGSTALGTGEADPSLSTLTGNLLNLTTATLQGLTTTLTNGVQAVGNALHGITGTLGDVSGSLGDTVGGLVGGASAPTMSAADLLTHNGAQADVASAATAAEPQPAASSISILDGHALVSDAGAPTQVDMAPLQLGFLGQSYVDPGDPHDGAFSAVGVHGFV
jgi:hypothetical protein